MGVGRQSRRVCFGAKPDKGFLDKKISPYPEVVRGRERELTTRPRERQLVVGQETGSWWLESRGSWWLETSRGVGSWTGERRVGGWSPGERVGGWRAERRQLRLETTEGSGDWTRERRTEKLAWKNGGAVNTRHRAERRGDKIGSSEEESQDV